MTKPESGSVTSGNMVFAFYPSGGTPPSTQTEAIEIALNGDRIQDGGIGVAFQETGSVAFQFGSGDLTNSTGADLAVFAFTSTPGPFEVSINGSSQSVTANNPTGLYYPAVYLPFGTFDPGGEALYSLLDLSDFGVAEGDSVESVAVNFPAEFPFGSGDFLGIGAIGGLTAIDLEIEGLEDFEEETIGGIIAVNDNLDEENSTTQGIPVLDDRIGTQGDRVVGEDDPDLVPATLHLLSSGETEGRWKLTYSDRIKVWKEDNNGFTKVNSGQLSPELTVDGTDTKIKLYIEGIEHSESTRDIEIKAEFVATDSSETIEDIAKLTAPKLEYVTYDPETGDEYIGEEIEFSSDLRPSVDMDISQAYLDASGNLRVSVSVSVEDHLSTLASNSQQQLQSLTFTANGRPVKTIGNLPSHSSGGVLAPWQVSAFNVQLSGELIIPPPADYDSPTSPRSWGGDTVIIRAETSDNAAGNAGYDQSAVVTSYRSESDFSPGMGNPHSVGAITLGDEPGGGELYYPVIDGIEPRGSSEPGSFLSETDSIDGFG